MLALAQPSEAKIVYTETHQVIGTNGIYSLDFNHDGIIDFLILESGYATFNGTAANNTLLAKEALMLGGGLALDTLHQLGKAALTANSRDGFIAMAVRLPFVTLLRFLATFFSDKKTAA
jgi:hypothetical protein